MGMIDRIKGILLEPKAEWPRISQEPASVQSLYLGWILWLAAIGPLVLLISFGNLGLGLRFAVGMYVSALIGASVLAVIADLLSTSFGGTRDFIAALKLIAYSHTAIWLAEIAFFIPLFNWLVVLVGWIYSLYLLFLGAPVLKKCAPEKAAAYTFVVVLCAIVLFYLMQRLVYGLGPTAGAMVMPGMGAG